MDGKIKRELNVLFFYSSVTKSSKLPFSLTILLTCSSILFNFSSQSLTNFIALVYFSIDESKSISPDSNSLTISSNSPNELFFNPLKLSISLFTLSKFFIDKSKSLFLEFNYHPSIVEVVKSCDGANWDAKEKIWEVPILSLSTLIDHLSIIDEIDLHLLKDEPSKHIIYE